MSWSPTKADPIGTHLAGEYLVAGELARRGYSVGITLGNTKAIDLFVERDGVTVPVQVKAIRKSSYAGWPLPLDKAKIVQGSVFVCVIVRYPPDAPTFFIIPAARVLELGRWYVKTAMLDLSQIKGKGFDDAWHLIDETLRGTRGGIKGAFSVSDPLTLEQLRFVSSAARLLDAQRRKLPEEPLRDLPAYEQFIRACYACGFVCPDIDGPRFDERFWQLTHDPARILGLDLFDLRRYAHTMMRGERFCDGGSGDAGGYIAAALRSGAMSSVSNALDRLIEQHDRIT